jgi:hypothetical protein
MPAVTDRGRDPPMRPLATTLGECSPMADGETLG